MQVLVFEDERFLGAITAYEVQQAGHTVLGPVFSVEEALRIAAADLPDMAMINVQGDHGGAAATALNDFWDTPCLLVADSLATSQKYSQFAVGCLTRPWSAETIGDALRVVEAIIEGSRIRDVPEAMTLFIDPPKDLPELSQAAGELPCAIAS